MEAQRKDDFSDTRTARQSAKPLHAAVLLLLQWLVGQSPSVETDDIQQSPSADDVTTPVHTGQAKVN